ncbi:putative HNH endonuclease [Vibrio chagasii]|nr:putative HNH endonuclease [Vibrio chagasii]
MDLVNRIKSQLSYCPETGQIKWKQSGTGRRNNLIAGNKRTHNGYTWNRIAFEGKEYTAAQIAWVIMNGEIPAFIINHKDGDSTNDTWSNLQRGDNCITQRNQRKSSRNKTGITGVRLNNGYYLAYIGSGNGQEYLGCRSNLFDAACLRKSAEAKLGYSARHGI